MRVVLFFLTDLLLMIFATGPDSSCLGPVRAAGRIPGVQGVPLDHLQAFQQPRGLSTIAGATGGRQDAFEGRLQSQRPAGS